MNKSRLSVRIAFYFIGLFIMTVGIAISIKTNLGVSPVSSIPYTINLVWGMETGNATIIFHSFLVLIQVIILRKKFKVINVLQVAVGVVFGKFITLSMHLMNYFPDMTNYPVRILMTIFSAFLIAIGIFFYVPAKIMPLAVEGLNSTIADKTGFKFSNIKIVFDCTVVAASLITCLIAFKSMGSVGVGTIIAALLVGFFHGRIEKIAGKWRDKLYLGKTKEENDGNEIAE